MPASVKFAYGMLKLLHRMRAQRGPSSASMAFSSGCSQRSLLPGQLLSHLDAHCLPFCCPADGRDDFVDVRRLSKCLPEVHRGLSKNAILGLPAGPRTTNYPNSRETSQSSVLKFLARGMSYAATITGRPMPNRSP